MPFQYSQIDRKQRSTPALKQTGTVEYYEEMDKRHKLKETSFAGVDPSDRKSGMSAMSSAGSEDSSLPGPPKSGFHAPSAASVDLSLSNPERETILGNLNWVVIFLCVLVTVLFGILVAFFVEALSEQLSEDAEPAPTTLSPSASPSQMPS